MFLLTSIAGSLLLPLPVAGQAGDAETSAESIRDCSRQNLPTQTVAQSFDLLITDRGGAQTEQRGKLRWRRNEAGLSEMNICFSAPSRLNGTCYLLLEKDKTDDIYVFLPSLSRVKRVVGGATSQTLLGTDISYADLKQLQGVAAGGSLQRQADGQLEEWPVYVVEGRPDPSQASPYTRLVSHIDKATCVPLQVDFYALGDSLRKQLTVSRDSLAQVEGRWQVQALSMLDVRENSRTDMRFRDIEYDPELPQRIFNQRSFYLAP